MSDLFWLTKAPSPLFSKCHGRPRVDDLRVLSGIIFINRNGLRWCDAPRECRPVKTLYNRWKRWSDNGVLARIMVGLTAEGSDPATIMRERNTKLHAVTDAKGRPIRFFMSTGQVSDDTGGAALLGNLPQTDWLLADRGYDADWLRKAF